MQQSGFNNATHLKSASQFLLFQEELRREGRDGLPAPHVHLRKQHSKRIVLRLLVDLVGIAIHDIAFVYGQDQIVSATLGNNAEASGTVKFIVPPFHIGRVAPCTIASA